MRTKVALAVSLAFLAMNACRSAGSGSRTLDEPGQGGASGGAPAAPGGNSGEAFVQARAHAENAGATTTFGLYNVTTIGAELDALPDPNGGFEYWPFVFNEQTNDHPWPYPDAIKWGWNAGGDQAKKCGKLSWHIMKMVYANKPQGLVDLEAAQGGPRSTFGWNNDYTQARAENMGFKAFWHYQRPNGLIKWVSNTKMDGSCQHPTVEAIDFWAKCEIKKLSNAAEQCRGHQ